MDFILTTCGHCFCTKHLTEVYEKQIPVGFSTDDNLRCITCDAILNYDDFYKITNLLCEHKFLQKHVIYDTHLFPTNELRNIVEHGKLYNSLHNFYMYWGKIHPEWNGDDDIINETVPDKIYFEKYNMDKFNIVSALFSENVNMDRISYRFLFK